MCQPVRLTRGQVTDLAVELSTWNPVPYSLEYVAKHELQCDTGMAFFVDTWPGCNAAAAMATSTCKLQFLQSALYIDAKDPDIFREFFSKIPVDWSKEFFFAAVHQKHYEACRQVSSRFGSVGGEIPELTMVQVRQNAVPDVPVPDGYTVDQLHPDEAGKAMQQWKFTGNFSQEAVQQRVEHCIQFHPSVAIRDQRGCLVAYEMMSPHGTMAMLHVNPACRGKGLGILTVAELCKKLQGEGLRKYCHVDAENTASIKVNKKCGFIVEDGAEIVWIFFKPS